MAVYSDQVKELREQGFSVAEIASVIGKSERTVSRELLHLGLTKSADRTDIDNTAVLDAWNGGLTVNEIAKKFHASHDTITKRLTSMGISSERSAGIRKHFSRVHDDVWPAIKSDLDAGLSLSFLQTKYHFRANTIPDLIKKHNYVRPVQRHPMPAAWISRVAEAEAMDDGKYKTAELFYLRAISQYYERYGSLPSVRSLAWFSGKCESHIYAIVQGHNLSEFILKDASSCGVTMIVDELCRLGITFELNNRSVLVSDAGYNLEMDVYIPSMKLGIEVNPVGTHSIDSHERGLTNRLYHQKKALAAESAGVGLLHMYDDDFQDPRKYGIFVRQMEARVAGAEHVGARGCSIGCIDYQQAADFLETYHYQGSEKIAKHRYGLFYNGVLVSVLCVGPSRYTSDLWEIIRYCVRPDIAVSGGFSRLLHYFIKDCNVCGRIVSYMDLDKRFYSGNVYEKNGFVLDGITQPDYVWMKKYGLPMLTRYETMKSKLVAQGFDGKKTEVEIMRKRGYFRVFRSGSKRFVLDVS